MTAIWFLFIERYRYKVAHTQRGDKTKKARGEHALCELSRREKLGRMQSVTRVVRKSRLALEAPKTDGLDIKLEYSRHTRCCIVWIYSRVTLLPPECIHPSWISIPFPSRKTRIYIHMRPPEGGVLNFSRISADRSPRARTFYIYNLHINRVISEVDSSP